MLKSRSESDSELVSTRLAPEEGRQLDRLVEQGIFLNRSDFLRMAAREKLQQIRVIELRSVPHAAARKEVLAYIRKHPTSYPSDIAMALRLDLRLVMEICRELLEARNVEEVKGHGSSENNW